MTELSAGKKRKRVECSECHKEISVLHVVDHARTHSQIRSYVCDEPDCGKTFVHSQSLSVHKLIHSGGRPLQCSLCPATFQTHGSRVVHMRRHTNTRPYVCQFDGCGKTFTMSGDLKVHERRHSGVRPFQCRASGCAKSFHASSGLNAHMRQVHMKEKLFICTFTGCGKLFSTGGNLKRHSLFHAGVKLFPCHEPGCSKRFSSKGDKDMHHRRAHSGLKPYECSFPGCAFKAVSANEITQHFKCMHTPRGQQRRKREEERIHKLLMANNVPFEREVQVDFKCALPERAQAFARIDFVIQRPDGTIFLLEVDEQQHNGYIQSCEGRRMMDVQASMLAAQPELGSVVWVRYNPNAFRVDEVKIKLERREREAHLLNFLRTYIPTQPFSIFYMYYDTELDEATEEQRILVATDCDYLPDLLPFVHVGDEAHPHQS